MSNSVLKPAAPSTDEVLLEIWRVKDDLSAQRGHNLDKLFADARERQKHSGHRVVDLSGKPTAK